MPESTSHMVPRDGTLILSDAAGAHTLALTYINGDFKWAPGKHSVSHVKPRGIIQVPPMLRRDEDMETTWSFTATLTDLSDAAYATLCEILSDTDFYATDWVSTAGAACDVKTVQAAFTVSKCGETHSATFAYSFLTGECAMGSPAIVTINAVEYSTKPAYV